MQLKRCLVLKSPKKLWEYIFFCMFVFLSTINSTSWRPTIACLACRNIGIIKGIIIRDIKHAVIFIYQLITKSYCWFGIHALSLFGESLDRIIRNQIDNKLMKATSLIITSAWTSFFPCFYWISYVSKYNRQQG